ncbi:MAG: hypothetical protein FWC20_06385 [Oscillospiraceae bacterium]|nr:hypothetical protein [Oscillospiraceae bacterium]
MHILKSKPKFGKNTGLTLNELLVVLVVIAVSAAVAIPAMIGFIRHGQQVNRMNVARTLYVAMQGQLTRAVAEGNLRVVLTDGFYHRDAAGELLLDEDYFELIADDSANEYFGRVAHRLGDYFPDEDEENEDYVFFISKPAGFIRNAPGGAGDTPVDKFYDLLSEVIIDTDILNDAILMEFNIRTGVVMSIFYGDHNPMWFQPGPRANSRHFVYDVDNDIDNVIGSRGMDDGGYAFASGRRQGYFGVNYTGEVPPLPLDDIVRIFDGMDFDDELGYGHGLNVGISGDRRINILFAEFLLIRPLADGDGRILAIFDDYDGAELITMPDPFSQMQSDFVAALTHSHTGNNHAFYSDDTEFTLNQFGINVAGLFSRYIWVLDYIEGNTFFEQLNNIAVKYGAYIDEPLNLRARVSESGSASTDSFMLANAHFGTKLLDGDFEIRSVRHLNNVRYFPNENFVQTAHIDMDTLEPIFPTLLNFSNFMPIGLLYGGAIAPFTGTYNAVRGDYSQWRIDNLVIDADSTSLPAGFAAPSNVGLFSEISGIAPDGSNTEGTVVGISLFGAEIRAPAADNVGAIAGTLRGGGTIARSNSFSNVTGGVGNTGGLVGRIDSGGVLTYSFNTGFFNTHPRENMPIEDSTATENGLGSVLAGLLGYGGGTAFGNVNIGGLVGSNAGTIRMSFNNARVNIYNVELSDEPWWFSINPTYIHITSPEATFLGGIVGENSGTIANTYATNFVAMYQSGNSGGITGRNFGAGNIINSHFITNGHTGSGLIAKEDLMHLSLTALPPGLLQQPVGFVSDQNARAEYLSEASAHFPKNIFDRYPYPRLANNNPFADIQYYFDEGLLSQFWGWEDIDAGGEFWLVYFELYSNGTYGLWPNTEIPGAEPLRNDLPIREAGYMLIAIAEGGSVPASFQLYVRPGNIATTVPWNDSHRYVNLITENNIVFSEGGLNLAGTDELGAFYHKLDLAALENLMGTNRNIPLRFATSNDLIPSDPSDIDADELSLAEGFVHPLFARALLVTDDITAFNYAVIGGDGLTHNLPVYEIRTPWQMQNIDRVNTGTEATWIPPTPGGGVAIPPPIPPGDATYANMGTISKGVTWGTTNIGGTPIGVGSAPAVPVEIRVSAVLQNTNPPGSVTESLSGNRTINASELNASTNRVTLSNGYITLVGDFSGINIQHSGWGSLTLGSDSVPFVSRNPGGSPAYIHSAVPLYIHVSNGMILDNAVIANSAGANMTFTSANYSGTGITATMNAIFYSTSSISGHIAVANWNANTLPQFYTANELRTLTMTGSAHMSGVFYARGLANIVFPGVTRFSGLIYSATNDIILGSNLTSGETIPITNIDIIPTLPGTGVLDPAVEAYLADRGWQFPDGGINGGGEDGRWELGTPALAFRQTRNISFRTPFTASFGLPATSPVGDRRVPALAAGIDGTTPRTPRNAIIGGDAYQTAFRGIFDGEGNSVSHVGINNIAANTHSGLFAENHGTIQYLIVRNSTIAGVAVTGGIAGRNMGIVQRSGVEHFIGLTAVESPTGNAVGGIVGENNNIVRDVYFLSTNSPAVPPVSNNGGGIVGENNGEVRQSFFLAPAPRALDAQDTDVTLMYPIVRAGEPATRYGREAGSTNCGEGILCKCEPCECNNSGGGGNGDNDEFFETNFYLTGFRHSLNEGQSWLSVWYNRINVLPELGYVTRIEGGGQGFPTRFLTTHDLSFIQFAQLGNWFQPTYMGGFPYPVIRGLPTPERWPLADAPPQPRQVEREEPWIAQTPTGLRPLAPDFINGDFSAPLLHRVEVDRFYTQEFINSSIDAGILPADYWVNVPNFRYMDPEWISIHMEAVDGWFTRPIPMNYSFFDNAARPPVANGRNDYFFPEATTDFPGGVLPHSTLIATSFVPTVPSPTTNLHNRATMARWPLIEMQEPNGVAQFMRTNFEGRARPGNTIDANNPSTAAITSAATATYANTLRFRRDDINAVYEAQLTANAPYRYVELNSQIAGTLYQVLPSTPGSQFFYSFYHATNAYPGTWPDWLTPPTAAGDRLSFFLSPWSEGAAGNPQIVRDAAHAALRDGQLVMIRPAQSPRSAPTGLATDALTTAVDGGIRNTTSIVNPAAWNTVAYGASTQAAPTANNSGGPFDLSFHRGKYYMQLDGRRVRQDIPTGTVFLYDVWIGDTTTTAGNGGSRAGVGITFWSTTSYSIGTIGATSIPSAGITRATFDAGAYAWLTAARNNVIGFWDISYGWKHFYGEYTVPAGQTWTEFAFQSNTGPTRVVTGNYLDGVTFRSPAFISVDQFVRDVHGSSVSFVRPGESLTVEMNLQNWGEVAADNIVLRNQLVPFTEYIEYLGNVRVNGSPVGTVGATAMFTDGVVEVRLPAAMRLDTNERLQVTFDIRVRTHVDRPGLDPGSVDTLLYEFLLQSVVTYYQDNTSNLTAFTSALPTNSGYSRAHTNSSEVSIVHIDPISLEKTVESVSHTGTEPDPLIDGPFRVTLRVEDTLGGDNNITTRGIITDIIPAGFRLTSFEGRAISGNTTFCLDGRQVTIAGNPDGTTRLTIWDVNLGEAARSLEFTYEMEFTGTQGRRYGVANVHIAATYVYVYRADSAPEPLYVMLNFPQSVVGISVRTTPDIFTVSNVGTTSLPITANDNFADRMLDSGYDVIPTVVFTDDAGVPLPTALPPGTSQINVTIAEQDMILRIIGGNQQLSSYYFTATILSGGTWPLEITPASGASGTFTLFYRIMLNATLVGGTPESFDLSSPRTSVTITILPGALGASIELYDFGDYLDGCLCLDCDENCECEFCPYSIDENGDVCDCDYDVCMCTDCGCSASTDAVSDDAANAEGDGAGGSDTNGTGANSSGTNGNDTDSNGANGNGNRANGNNASDDVGANVDVSDVLIVTGFAFGGGFGISRIRKLKLAMRRLNGRTAHKINIHNERKQGR